MREGPSPGAGSRIPSRTVNEPGSAVHRLRLRVAATITRAGSVLGIGGTRWSPDVRRASWARPLLRLEDAPEPFHEPLAAHADTEGHLPGAILTPCFRNGRVYDSGRKVLLADRKSVV